jgi:peptidoglycan hydrolase CwlO-like protein
MESSIISALIGLLGIVTGIVAGYLINRRQQLANTAKIETDTRIAEGAAKATDARNIMELRLLHIEANQKEAGYYQGIIADMVEREQARTMDQAALLAKIDGLVISLADADKKIAALQDQITELQNRVEGSNEIITNLQAQVVGLQKEVREGNETITLLRDEIKDLIVERVQIEKDALTKALE